MVSTGQGSCWFGEHVPGHTAAPSGVSAAVAAVAAALLLLGASPATATFSGVDGDLAYETEMPPGIGVAAPSGDVHTPLGLTSGGGGLRDPAWSPNATRLAFTATRAGNTDIYSVTRDGTDERRLTVDPAPDSGATWSPDSGSIAFESTRHGNTDIYVMKADGTAPRRLTSAPGVDQHPAWSPDGRRIAFESGRDGNIELYVMAADGSAQTRLTFGPLPDRDPSWSPDGRKIAFASGTPPTTDLFTIRPNSGLTRQLTTNPAADESPAWSPDGRLIAFSSDRGGASILSLYVIDADGAPEADLRALGVRGRNADWAQLPPPTPVPTPESTANATPTDNVLVHLPGTGASVPLTSPREIPLGTRLDARAGAVKLSTALPGEDGTATTTASGAIFALSQSAAGATTDLTLNSSPCASGRASTVRRPRPPDPTLRVKVRSHRHHHVRVAGQYSIGAANQTAWTTINRCSGTVTRVTEGTVTVRDLVAKRTVEVHPGRRRCTRALRCVARRTPGEYVARAPLSR
jgi:Tol biopolymer transport system component